MPLTNRRFAPWDTPDQPLDHCPRCDHDLSADGGVTVRARIRGQEAEVTSRFHAGALVDSWDSALSRGMVTAVECGSCGNDLKPYEVPAGSDKPVVLEPANVLDPRD